MPPSRSRPSDPHVVIVPYARFGQGDGAACSVIARRLASRGARVTFLARGSVADVARRHGQWVVPDRIPRTEEFLSCHAAPIGMEDVESFLLLRPQRRSVDPAVELHLSRAVEALRRQFAALRPDLVLAAFHWPALLAARSMGIPTASLIQPPNDPRCGCPANAVVSGSVPPA